MSGMRSAPCRCGTYRVEFIFMAPIYRTSRDHKMLSLARLAGQALPDVAGDGDDLKIVAAPSVWR